MLRRRAIRISLSLLGCTAFAAPAHAYLDPGTGSIILQSILAGIAVAMGVLRLYWYKLKALFTGKSAPAESRDGPDADAQNKT